MTPFGAKMNFFREVKAEHRVLEKIVERLELAAQVEGIGAWGRIWGVLAILLPILEIHEEMENSLIEKESYLKERGAAAILDAIEEQHLHLKRLIEQISALPLQPGHGPLGRLRKWSKELAWRLRDHFKMEEERLWPHYSRTMSRSLVRSMGRRIESNVLGVEKMIGQKWDQGQSIS